MSTTCYVKAAMGTDEGRGRWTHTRKVRAEVVDCHFAINRLLVGDAGKDNRFWSLTHRPTGYRVATVRSKRDARKLARLINRVAAEHDCTWDSADVSLLKAWPAAAKAALKSALMQVETF